MLRYSSAGVSVAWTLLATACSSEPSAPDFVPTAIKVVASASTIQVNDTASFRALFQAGTRSHESDASLRWKSTRPWVFEIDSLTGRGTARSLGLDSIIATARGLADTVVVTVVPTVDGIMLGISRSVAVGSPISAVLFARGNLGSGYTDRWYQVTANQGPVTFRASNPAVVSVDSGGRLSAASAGTSMVVATLQGQSDSASITVGVGVPIELRAGTDSLTLGDVNDTGMIAGFIPGRGSIVRTMLVSRTAVTQVGDCVPHQLNNAGQLACGRSFPALYSNGVLTYPFGQASGGMGTGVSESGVLFGLHGTTAFTWSSDGANNRDFGAGASASGKVNGALHGLADYGGGYSTATIVSTSGSTGLSASAGRYSHAQAINDADDVVGYGENMALRLAGPSPVALLWRSTTKWIPERLGVLAIRATGISEAGVVVGEGVAGPFIWSGGRQALLSEMVSEIGWTFSGTPAISRNGTIAVQGIHTSGRRGIVLLPAGTVP